jgi:hypothetical protein
VTKIQIRALVAASRGLIIWSPHGYFSHAYPSKTFEPNTLRSLERRAFLGLRPSITGHHDFYLTVLGKDWLSQNQYSATIGRKLLDPPPPFTIVDEQFLQWYAGRCCQLLGQDVDDIHYLDFVDWIVSHADVKNHTKFIDPDVLSVARDAEMQGDLIRGRELRGRQNSSHGSWPMDTLTAIAGRGPSWVVSAEHHDWACSVIESFLARQADSKGILR